MINPARPCIYPPTNNQLPSSVFPAIIVSLFDWVRFVDEHMVVSWLRILPTTGLTMRLNTESVTRMPDGVRDRHRELSPYPDCKEVLAVSLVD
jgi:hypothetical protein